MPVCRHSHLAEGGRSADRAGCRHRSGRVHRFAPCRGARRLGRQGASDGPVQRVRFVGLARDPRSSGDGWRRGGPRRRPRPGLRPRLHAWRGGRLPPRRPDWHPVLLPGAAFVPGDERGRNAQHPRVGTGARHPARRPHVDERGLRYGALGTDRRAPSAPGTVSVLGVEGRRRQARRELPPQLRPAGCHAATIQHVRTAPVDPRRHPHDRDPAPRRRAGPQAGTARSHPRLHLRCGYRRRVPCGRWRSGRGGAGTGAQRRLGHGDFCW